MVAIRFANGETETDYLKVKSHGTLVINNELKAIGPWKKFSIYPGKGTQTTIDFIYNDELFIGGGRYGSVFDNSLWKYSFETKEWELFTELPFIPDEELIVTSWRKYEKINAIAKGNSIYFFCSYEDENAYIWKLDMQSLEWEKLGGVPHEKYYYYPHLLNNEIYVACKTLIYKYMPPETWEVVFQDDNWRSYGYLTSVNNNFIAIRGLFLDTYIQLT